MATQTIDLGNTDSVTYDGSEVCEIVLDGSTIWEGCAGTLMYSFGVTALNNCLPVDSFIPFYFASNTIDYFVHLDWVGSSQAEACTSAAPAFEAWMLGAGTMRLGVNRTAVTHGISDANAANYYDQANKKNYIVTAVNAGLGTEFGCGAVNSDTKRFTVVETDLSLLGGTKWLNAGGPWNGLETTFYYGTGGVGDNQQSGVLKLGGSATYTWSWARTTTRVCTMTGGGLNVTFTAPTDFPVGTSVTVAGSHTWTMTRNA